MGDWFQTFVDIAVTPTSAPALAARVTDQLIQDGIVAVPPTDCVLSDELGFPPGRRWSDAVADDDKAHDSFLNLRTNGLEVAIGRDFFDCGQADPYFRCPRGHVVEWASCLRAIEHWHEVNDDATLLTCNECGQSVRLTAAESNCALGYLGLTFWNWPRLSREFADYLTTILDGDEVRCIHSKL